MEEKVLARLDELIIRYPNLKREKENILMAYHLLEQSYVIGGKLLVAGNGGSASDAEHIVGELMKGFVKPRKIEKELAENLMLIDEKLGNELAEKLQGALPAIALVGHVALSTAYLNDVDPMLGFAQQLNGYGKKEDVFLGISTSGNSKNIINALS